jgi:hypothetical protein
MRSDPSVVVVSKPYQALMALSSLDAANERATLFVVTRGFSFAQSFCRFLTVLDRDTRIERTVFVNTYEDLLPYKDLIRGRKLYVEDDRVSLYLFFKSLAPQSLWVFEEGFGTYNGNYANLRRGWMNKARYAKWLCYSLLTGCGLHFGGGRDTKGIFCTNPDLYRRMNPSSRKQLIRIRSLDAYREFFHARIAEELGSERCATRAVVVLGPWGGGYDTLKTLPRDADAACFYKAHPHTPVTDPRALGEFRQLNIEIPAEYQIEYLADRFTETHVYHFSSTAALHDYGTRNIVFHDLARDQRFVALEKALRECR